MKVCTSIIGLALFCFSVMATPINITSTKLGGLGDNAVSPGCDQGNVWDLESVLLDGTQLSLVGSYDFKNGQVDPYRSPTTYYSGDIFIDLDNNAKNFEVPNSNGSLYENYLTFNNSATQYDYAIKLDFNTNTYTAYKLDNNSVLSSVYFNNYDLNNNGNPFQLVSGGIAVGTGTLGYQTGLADNASLGYTSWGTSSTHNMVTVDLASLHTNITDLTTHFTIGCGNDVLTGSAKVPEPGMLSLAGLSLMSLIGLAASRRKK